MHKSATNIGPNRWDPETKCSFKTSFILPSVRTLRFPLADISVMRPHNSLQTGSTSGPWAIETSNDASDDNNILLDETCGQHVDSSVVATSQKPGQLGMLDIFDATTKGTSKREESEVIGEPN